MIKVMLNKDRHVVSYSLPVEADGDPCFLASMDGECLVNNFDITPDFEENYYQYKLTDECKLVKDTSYFSDVEKNLIRNRREVECYRIINRGTLWYDLLTEDQRKELQVWYQAWLDAPETWVIPDPPKWIKE